MKRSKPLADTPEVLPLGQRRSLILRLPGLDVGFDLQQLGGVVERHHRVLFFYGKRFNDELSAVGSFRASSRSRHRSPKAVAAFSSSNSAWIR